MSELTLQEREIRCICPIGTLCFRGASAGGVLPCRLSLHALLVSRQLKCKVPRERTKDGNLPVLKNPIICLLKTDIHM